MARGFYAGAFAGSRQARPFGQAYAACGCDGGPYCPEGQRLVDLQRQSHSAYWQAVQEGRSEEVVIEGRRYSEHGEAFGQHLREQRAITRRKWAEPRKEATP